MEYCTKNHTDVSGLSERGTVANCEGDVETGGDGLSQQRFARTRGTQHDDVTLVQPQFVALRFEFFGTAIGGRLLTGGGPGGGATVEGVLMSARGIALVAQLKQLHLGTENVVEVLG